MRTAATILLLLAAVILTGMGGVGGVPEGAIPETKENIRARVLDRQGIRTDLQRFSLDGKTFLSAARGSGSVTIPFGEILSIDFEDPSGNGIPVQVQLARGEKVSLQMERGAIFHGSTGYGSFQIRARDLRRIELPRDSAR